MSLPVLLVLTFLAAAAVAALAGLACKPLAHRVGAVARPRGDRWRR